LLISPLVILRTPTDIFPEIDIPVVSVIWNYNGLSATEMERRVTSGYERYMTTAVDNVSHIESQTVSGRSIIKVFFQPGASIALAMAQISAASQGYIRFLPPGMSPAGLLVYSASTVPILQLGLGGQDLSEQELNDLAMTYVRPVLIRIPGVQIPF